MDLFGRVGLRTNTEKTKVMVCLPGSIRTYYSHHAYKRKLEGQGDTYRQRKRRQVACTVCSKDLSEGSIVTHIRTQHNMEPLPPEATPPCAPVGYNVEWPQPRGTMCPCPAPDCDFKAGSENLLRRHFTTWHPRDVFRVRGRTFHAPCELYGMQVSPNNMRQGHWGSDLCAMLRREREQARALAACQEAQSVEFTTLGLALGKVSEFRYLGRILSEYDSDYPAMRRNLTKTRQRWARLSRILVWEGASPKVSGFFYLAVVQSVLLFGSETWVWSESMRLTLRGFHHWVARRLTGLSAHRHNGGWVVPPAADALRAAGLLPIEEYITCR